MPEEQTVYFAKPGQDNTAEVLALARRRAKELGIKTIVVASTTGDTGAKAADIFQGDKVVVVTHSTGFRTPNTQELTEENRARIIEKGGIILTAQHTFAGVGRAVRHKFGTYELDDIVANVLRLFGQGAKVACEIVVMAADAGLVRTDEEVIAIAGTDRGADTALVMKPANAHDFFSLRVKEILCKPRL